MHSLKKYVCLAIVSFLLPGYVFSQKKPLGDSSKKEIKNPKKDVVKKSKFPPKANPKEAREMLSLFKKRISKAKKLPQVRIELIKSLVEKSHKSFVKALIKVAQKDKSKLVRAEAYRALGKLDYRESRKALYKALKKTSLINEPLILFGIFDALENIGYRSYFFEPLSDIFESAWETKKPAEIQKRIINIFGKAKEKKAFRLLVNHLDEPIPKNVDDPSNPPASWWEKRWKAWDIWKKDVKKALISITGVEFDRASFYKKWAKKVGRKFGIKY